MRQAIEVECPVPALANTSTRRSRFKLQREKKLQQEAVREALDLMGRRPELPCKVTLHRIASTRLDSDGPVMALKYVRDTVARWIHGLPETIPLLKDGRPVLDKAGKPKTTRPPAPDGPNDQIEWAYGAQIVSKKREPVVDSKGRPKLTKGGRPKMRGVTGTRIVIEEVGDLAAE